MASTIPRELRPLRPTPLRDLLYQLLVLAFFYACAWLSLEISINLRYVLLVLSVLFLVLTGFLTVQSWIGGLSRRAPEAKQLVFHWFGPAGGPWVNVMLPGVGAGTEVFTGAFHEDDTFEPRSYAAAFNGERVLLVDWPGAYAPGHTGLVRPSAYDEPVMFEQLHGELSGPPAGTLVAVTAHSSSANFIVRWIAWLDANYPTRPYAIKAVHYPQPAAKLRGLQQVLCILARPYKGSPTLQWIWQRGLWSLVWPEQATDRARCEADGREPVFKLIRSRMQFLSIDGLLARMSALLRSHAFETVGAVPSYLVYVTEVGHDETVDPAGNEKGLVLRYYGAIMRVVITGSKLEVGHHGTLAEFPRWHQAGLDFKAERDAYTAAHP